MKDVRRLLSLILALALMLLPSIALVAEGGTDYSEKAEHTVTINISADIDPAVDFGLKYRSNDLYSYEKLVSGKKLKARVNIIYDWTNEYKFYANGVEMHYSDYEMPNEDLTIDIVKNNYFNKNFIVACDGVVKPDGWKTVTIDAGEGIFQKSGGNEDTAKILKFYVNPLYEVELIEANSIYDYFGSYSLKVPKGKFTSKSIKKQFTNDETFKIEYKDMTKITLNLYKRDKTVETIEIPGSSTYKDILSKIREHQSPLSDDEKFVCWSRDKDEIEDTFVSKDDLERIKDYRIFNGVILPDKYNDYIDYKRYVGKRYDGFKTIVDLYEVVTKKQNPVVYNFDITEYEHEGRKLYSPHNYGIIRIINPAAEEKLTFGDLAKNNRYDKTKLYKIKDFGLKTFVELNLNEIIKNDIDVADIIKEKDMENADPTFYVKGEPRVNYIGESNAKLDLSHMVIVVVDKNNRKKETYIPFEEFDKKGITTIPKDGTTLDASFNGKSIKVIYNDKFAYTTEYLMVEKESDLYEPVYDVLEEKVGNFIYTRIKFLDEKSVGPHKYNADKKPIYYEVTFEGEETPELSLDYYGNFSYLVQEKDEGKAIKLPVLITYRDGSTDRANIIINVKPLDGQSEVPNVEDVIEGATVIKGTGTKWASIKVLKGEEIIAEYISVDSNGNWKVENIDSGKLKAGDKLTIKQTESNKKSSSIEVIVMAGAPKLEHTVKFMMNGHGEALADKRVKDGETLEEPTPAPAEEGFKFEGWYTEATFEYKYDFKQEVKSELILYAKWTVEEKVNKKHPAVPPKEKIEVVDINALSPEEKIAVKAAVKAQNPEAKEVDVTENGTITITYVDGSTNIIKAADVVVKKAFTPPTPTNPIVGPVDPSVNPNPDESKNWTVTFKAGASKGTIAAENTFYVLKTEQKTLADLVAKAPKVTAKEGFKVTGWNPALDENTSINGNLEVNATFEKVTGSENPASPDVDPITVGDEKVLVKAPRDGDKVIVTLQDNTKVEVTKSDNEWKTSTGVKVTVNNDNKLEIPVDGKKIIADETVKIVVENTETKKESTPTKVIVAKNSKKQVNVTVSSLGAGNTIITVTTSPAGAKVTLFLGEEEINTVISNVKGVANFKLKEPTQTGQYYTVKVTMDGYEPNVQIFKVD